MNIKKLWNKVELNDWWIYKDPLFTPFINAHFLTKSKFKLFHKYIINCNIVEPIIYKHFEQLNAYLPNILNKENKINLKNKIVQREMYDYWEIYIGNTFSEKERKFIPLFLHVNIYDNMFKEEYIKTKKYFNISGFHVLFGEELNSKVKEYSKINNLWFELKHEPPMYFYGKLDSVIKSLYENIKYLSDKTKKQLNNKGC